MANHRYWRESGSSAGKELPLARLSPTAAETLPRPKDAPFTKPKAHLVPQHQPTPGPLSIHDDALAFPHKKTPRTIPHIVGMPFTIRLLP